jgi:GAF domain-containing protein
MLRSALIADATEAIHEPLDLDEVVQRVVEQACRMVGAASATLRLTDEEGGLHLAAAQVDVAGHELPEPAEPDDDLLEVVGNTREPALLNSGTVSVLCVPIVHHDHLLGLLTLSAGAANRFSDGDAALLGRFARPVANAIANAQRYEAAVFLLDLGTEDTPAA